MNNKKQNRFNEIPLFVYPSFPMSEPNEEIPIHEGKFVLTANDLTLTIEGKIFYQWLPRGSVIFEGIVTSAPVGFKHLKMMNKELILLINELQFDKAIILKFTLGDKSEVRGKIVSKPTLFGDPSISVEKIKFAIPNLRYFNGDPTKIEKRNGVQLINSRLCLNNEYYSINIDQTADFKQLDDNLKKRGGYLILYGGEITKYGKKIDYEELQNLRDCLNKFLSFLNGKRCSLMFCQGVYGDEVIWTYYTNYIVDQYKYVNSWPQAHSIFGLNDLWCKFYKLWQDPNDRDFISTAIHWYTEANMNTGYLEGSLIMGQIALELIYNWLVIEKKHILYGKDAESISASNKIRLLLSQVEGTGDIPEAFGALKSYLSNNQDISDGVDIIVQIRNIIIHAQEEKRNKLINIEPKVKYEAQQLALWYIEYSLLYILEYKGKYFNRTSGKQWSGEGEEDSPYNS